MWERLFAIISIILYTFSVYGKKMTAKEWIIINLIVQILGLLYILNCKNCFPQSMLLLLVILAVLVGYQTKLETGTKWGFIDGFTVAIWTFILLDKKKYLLITK